MKIETRWIDDDYAEMTFTDCSTSVAVTLISDESRREMLQTLLDAVIELTDRNTKITQDAKRSLEMLVGGAG